MMAKKSTTDLLKQLRILMSNKEYIDEQIHAYIIPSNDAHNSEYLAECDKFRKYISGFDGSLGTAIITLTEACLWTDGRYYIQASQQLDSNWKLMKEGEASTPSQGVWLSKTLPLGSKIGIDPKLYTLNMWHTLEKDIKNNGHSLIPLTTNLIEIIWTDRPNRPTNPVIPLPIEFTGKSVCDKLSNIRKDMKDMNVEILVLTALDEIAWVLNLRGSDIEYNPVFFSYVIIKLESIIIFINPQQVSEEMNMHLQNEIDGPFEISNYNDIHKYLKENTLHNGFIWFSNYASYFLTNLISPEKLLLTDVTPVCLMKAIKNPVERNGMRNAHIKDAVALCCYFSWLEKNVNSMNISEICGAKKLLEFRQQQADFIGPSFGTISSFGPHGAIIHYEPKLETDTQIKSDSLYLCDSGGQYRDGTTDVTRTFHFGTPTEYEKECFTRVLKGQLKLARTIFPRKIRGNHLDSFAREFLWQVGLNYAHGTGHGIGAYLNVHEGPMGISWRVIPEDPGLETGMFLSNEPGYYEAGKFGIRIEDVVEIIEANPPHNFNNTDFLKFETITLVPKQQKLIAVEMLTKEEIDYLNEYHQKCRHIIGPLLEKSNQLDAKQWLWKETEPLQIIKK